MTEPATPLEHAILDAREGRLPVADLLRLFATTPIFIPTVTEVAPDGDGFTPLTLDKDGVAMVVCFTGIDRIGDARAAAPYCMQIPGGAFLQLLPRGIGLVVNPGSPLGFDMSPDGLERFLADFGRLA